MSRALSAVLVISLASVLPAAEPLDTFLRVVPGDANAVMVLRVRELVNSPRGKAEGWAEKQREEFLAGSQTIPPWVTSVYRASRLRPEEGQTLWSVGVVGLPSQMSLDKIAEQEQTTIETVAGTTFVKSRRGNFLTSSAPSVLTVFGPGYRQDFARWLKFAESNTEPQLSPYLQDATAKSTLPIVIALDLQDALNPALVRNWVRHSKAVKLTDAEASGLSGLLQGIRGVRLEASVDETTQVRVSLDFSAPVEGRGPAVKAIVLEFLEHSGSVIDEFEDAKVEMKGSTVVLSTALSDDGLRRILSVITAPNPLSRSGAPMATPQTTPRPYGSIDVSRRYYTAVNKMVDDLMVRHQRAKNYEKTATWHDNYAKKIDELSIDNVQPDLARYGAEMSSRLHALAASLRGAKLEVQTIGETFVYSVQVNPGAGGFNVWGGVGWQPPSYQVDSNLQTVRERQAEAVLRGAGQRDQIWAEIEKDRKAIRFKMQEVFAMDFDAKPR